MFVMFIGSFIVQYFLMPVIMVSNISYITNNIGKAYLGIIMGITMVLLEIMMHDYQYHVLSINWYAILFALLAIFIYFYRKQIAIKDKEYLKGMIEHHSMALLTSEEILKKTDNYDVAKLAKNIIQTQTDELDVMKKLVKNSES
jgi:Ca2+/Na+ antiporter